MKFVTIIVFLLICIASNSTLSQDVLSRGKILIYPTGTTYPQEDFYPLYEVLSEWDVTIVDRAHFPAITFSYLSQYDQFWFISTSTSGIEQLSQQEITDILTYRESGKGVYLGADDVNYQADINQLSIPLGIEFSGDISLGAECVVPTGVQHPLLVNVNELYAANNEGRMLVNSPNSVIASMNNEPIIAIRDDGMGRVVFDASFVRILNQTVFQCDDSVYANNIADWLQLQNGELYVPSISTYLYAYGFSVPLWYSCKTATKGVAIPLEWNDPSVEMIKVTYDNTALEPWEIGHSINNGEQTVLIGGGDITNDNLILPDTEVVLANLVYDVSYAFGTIDTICMYDNTYIPQDSISLEIDTTTIGADGLLFSDSTVDPGPVAFVPGVNLSGVVIYKTYKYLPGDMTSGSSPGQHDGAINILDIIYLINHKFEAGPKPKPISAGDVNGDCEVNILDIIYLIDYKFKGGPDPVCGCAEEGAPVAYKGNPDGDLIANSIEGETSILLNTDNNLRGIEMTLKVLDGSTVEVTNKPENFEVYYSQEGDIVKLGLLDFEAGAVIDSKTETILTFDGPVEIIEALGADENTAPVYFNIVNKGEASTNLPTTNALHQNYPNPFNPETQISFSLPERADVKLDIYNIMGQKVATVAEGSYEAGIHTVTWDGSQSASGVYFYKLTAGDYKKTRKMLLLK